MQNKPNYLLVVPILYFYNKTHKYDNVPVAPIILVKVVLHVSSTGCFLTANEFVNDVNVSDVQFTNR